MAASCLALLLIAEVHGTRVNSCSEATATTKGSPCLPLTCSLSYERVQGLANLYNWNKYEGTGVMFKDKTFAAGQQSLYWDSFLEDREMFNIYQNVRAWKRPTELISGQPSLWGS